MISNLAIPTEWQLRRISDVFEVRAGGDIEWAKWSREQDSNHPFPVYANGRAHAGLHGYASYSVEDGDAITLTARGTPGELGHAFYRESPFTPIGRLLVLRSKNVADARFFAAYINGVVRFAQENTGVAQLTAPQVAQYQIYVPPVHEQRAIATALSDVDALITGLERLIAKKRDIKQATMQQLLTGQTRLPGFSGDWEVKRLKELASLKNGYIFRSETYTSTGAYKVITIANVQDGRMVIEGCNTVSAPPIDIQSHQRLAIGDILISMTGNVGRVCRVTESDCLLNQRVGTLVPTAVQRDFLFVLLRQPAFISSMIGAAKGGAQPNLSASDINEHAFLIPKEQAEQAAIATVLSDMDADLYAIEARFTKTRAIKQGMMQELLTGRTRLVGNT